MSIWNIVCSHWLFQIDVFFMCVLCQEGFYFCMYLYVYLCLLTLSHFNVPLSFIPNT